MDNVDIKKLAAQSSPAEFQTILTLFAANKKAICEIEDAMNAHLGNLLDTGESTPEAAQKYEIFVQFKAGTLETSDVMTKLAKVYNQMSDRVQDLENTKKDLQQQVTYERARANQNNRDYPSIH